VPEVWDVAVACGQVNLGAPKALHKVVSTWLDARDEAPLRDPRRRHHAPDKHYAVRRVRRVRSGFAVIEVVLLDESLNETLRRCVTARCDFGAAVVSAIDLRLVERVSWDELRSTSGDHVWNVRFESATTFRSGPAYSPWPDPITVVTSVHERLRRLGIDVGTLPVLRRDGLRVSRVEGRTELVAVNVGRRPGFVGEVEYQADPDCPGLAQIDTVFRCARYTGVGAHTAYGLGAVEVRGSKRPPSRSTTSSARPSDWTTT
jgi:hypothetical protein